MTKWMKNHKNEEENAALQEQLIRELNQQQEQEKNPLVEEQPMEQEQDTKDQDNDYINIFSKL